MILGLGSLAVDDLLGVDHFPIAGQKMRVAWRRRERGGVSATALTAAAKLGARVEWLGTLGSDELSEWALKGLQHDGVGTQFVRSEAGARPHASVILVEAGGQRTILSSTDGVPVFPPDALTVDTLEDATVVFVDHTQVPAARRLAQLARERGVPVVGDIERAAEGIEELLPLINHFVCGIGFGRTLTGEMEPAAVLAELREKFGAGATCCVVTDGEHGCWYLADGREGHVPAFAVEAIDTTGCGDSFHGAYLAEIGRGVPVEEALHFASAVAAIVATRVGGRSGLPVREEVEVFMEAR